MFGLACEICWDRNCNCTNEDRIKYNSLKTKSRIELEYTKTEPNVCSGDLIFQDNNIFRISKVVNGVGYKAKCSDNSNGKLTKLKVGYLKIESALQTKINKNGY